MRIEQIGHVASLDTGDVSFCLLPFDLSAYWDETVARLRALVDRPSHFAVAESYIESGAHARSVVGWTGDLATVWSGLFRPTSDAPIPRCSMPTPAERD